VNFKASKPDARILILQIVAASILSFYFKSQLATFCFFLVIDFLIFFWYGAKVFFQRLVAYACLNALTWGLLIVEIPVLSVVLPSFLMMIVRVFPIYLLLKLLMDKTPMDELLYSLDAIHIPKSLSIPLMVVYRYVPTILQEFCYVNESLKMRGLNLSVRNLKHLIPTIENYMVPLLFRSEKLSEELSAASLCKGLSVERNRSCCTEVKLTLADFLYLLGMAVVICGLLYLDFLNF
jgi:hypothetical protein